MKRQKSTRTVLVVLVLLAVGLQGCDLLGPFLDPILVYPAITSRVESFYSDLNKSDRTGLSSHFHPLMQDKSAYNANQLFTTGPFYSGYEPFTVVPIADADIDKTGSDSYTVTTSMENDNGTFEVVFLVQESEGEWLIRKITIEINGVPFEIKVLS